TIDVPPTQVAYITIVVHLVALVLVHIVELLRSPQDLAGAHCDWRTSLIEKCIDFACPCGIRDRIGPPALCQPLVPQPVDIRVMQVKDRILRCSGDRAHPTTNIYMRHVMRDKFALTLCRIEGAVHKPGGVVHIGSW